MKAPLVRKPRVETAYFEPADVRRIDGYRDGTRTRVTLVTGKVLYLDVPVEEVRVVLDAESRDILRRGLDRIARERAANRAAHPEYEKFYAALDLLDEVLLAAEETDDDDDAF